MTSSNERSGTTRRVLLRVTCVAGIVPISGCMDPFERGDGDHRGDIPDQDNGDVKTVGREIGDPRILEVDYDIRDNGTELFAELQGSADVDLEYLSIEYGNKRVKEKPDGKKASAIAIFEDAHKVASGDLTFTVQDIHGNTTQLHTNPDPTAPKVHIDASPTQEANTVKLGIQCVDEIGLGDLEIRTGDAVIHSFGPEVVGGRDEFTSTVEIVSEHLNSGYDNTFEIRATDWNGNKSSGDTKTFVRKYDVLEDGRLDIGVVYIPPAGDGLKRCLEGTEAIPSIGMYGRPIPPEITNAHIDQMTGHGITRILYGWEGRDISYEKAEAFLQSEMVDQLDSLEVFFGSGALTELFHEDWKEESFPEQLPFLREKFLSHEKVTKYDERPVFSTWNMRTFALGDEREKVIGDFGSLEGFVDEMRSHLEIDGVNPFLVAGVGTDHIDEQRKSLIEHFDAVGTWFPPTIHESGELGEPASWDETYELAEDYFQHLKEFAAKSDIELIPMSFPGYNERGNVCYGRDRELPRSKSRFKQMLELADKYASTDMINIASWNDWPEGHQIEPGKFMDENYGTNYVQIVKDFQTN